MSKIISRRTLALGASTLLVAGSAWSQSGRPIHVLVPGPVGSAMDGYLRAVQPAIGQRLGVPLVVDNLPGAGGTLATAQAARAAADGNTLLIVSSNHVVNPSLFKSLPYDVIQDFSPITIVGTVPLVLVAAPSVSARNIPELIAQMKAKPGEFNYGSLGVGTVLHLAGEAFNNEAGVTSRHIPYKDASTLLTDLANGQIQLAYLALPSVASQVKAGRIKALGVTNATRAPTMPDVPAIAETLPKYVFDAWIALLGPKGMSPELARKYFEAVKEAMSQPVAKEALANLGIVPVLTPPDKVRAFMQSELEKHTALAKHAGLSPQ